MSQLKPGLNVEKLIFEDNSHQLYHGTFGQTSEIPSDLQGKEFALKVVNVQEKSPQSLREEVNVMIQTKHNFIISVYDYFEDENRFYIVMEYAESGTLQELFELLPQSEAVEQSTSQRWCRQLALALRFLHSSDIGLGEITLNDILLVWDESKRRLIAKFGKIGAVQSATKDSQQKDIQSLAVHIYRHIIYRTLIYSNSMQEKIDDMLSKMKAKEVNADQVLEHPWWKAVGA